MKGFSGLRLTATAILLATLAACSSTPPAPPAPAPAPVVAEAPKPMAPTPPAPAPKPPTPAPVAMAKPPLPAYLDPGSILYQQRSLYFSFDSALVGDKFMSLLDAHGQFLALHPAVHISVDGNTDERGSAEYNLALGQRRSDAVVKALTTRGVALSQLEAHSWGKEKPVAAGHDEESWAKNRRVDLIYPDH